MSYCAGVWTGVCLHGAWMIGSVRVCVSVRLGFASGTSCIVDALFVAMQSNPSKMPAEMRPIEKFVRNLERGLPFNRYVTFETQRRLGSM